MKTISEAVDAVLAEVRALPEEEVSLLAALGRTAARDLLSSEAVPGFANSAMDGYGVRTADAIAGRELQIVAEIPAGEWVDRRVGAGEAVKIMTGAPLPPDCNAVVPVEQTEEHHGRVLITAGVEAGANVRLAGEDIRPGDLLVAQGSVLRPAHLGQLAAVGIGAVPVRRRPRVAILATGSELQPVESQLKPGQIRDSNSYTAYGQVLEAGAEPLRLGVAHDDVEETRALLGRALQEDVVITSGGVSVGEYDFVKRVQEELGVEKRFWGVRCKPGKPLVFGVRGRTLVFGVPGNPVAAMVTFEVYVRPALLALAGRTDLWRPCVRASADEPVPRSKERAELRRCRLRRRDGEWHFSTTGPQGSGILSSMAAADGLAFVPSGYAGGDSGVTLDVMLLDGSSRERPRFPE